MECLCYEASVDELIVDCSKAVISQIPTQLPRLTTTAIFTNHKIVALPPRAFEGCSLLLSLDISNGILSNISSTSFASLFSLRYLALNNNNLDFSIETFVENNAFKDLFNLVTLKLENNKKPFVQESSIRNDLFATFTDLRNISVDFPNKVTLFGNVTWMLRLHKLEIYGSLKKVFDDTFAAIKQTRINYLGIHSQMMEDVDALAFAHFPYLEVLNLSYTRVLGFKNVSKAWYGLVFTSVRVLDLTRIAPYERQLITVTSDFYTNLKSLNITDLYIDANNILMIENGFLYALPKVRYLSLTNNRLCSIFGTWVEFNKMKSLRILDTSFQQKRTLRRRATNSTMQSNDSSIHSNLHSPVEIKRVAKSIRYNVLPNIFELTTFPFILPRCLREFRMAESWSEKLENTPNIYFLGHSRLRLFNSSNNGFTMWNSVIRFAIPPRNKITIDLSKNGCRQISQTFFRYSCQYFDKLFLAHNQLQVALSTDDSRQVFEHCFHLEVLDLASNDLKLLPRNIFHNLTSLQYLNLTMNSLRTLNVTISHMRNLRVLDLSLNLIGFLSNDALDEINTLVNLTIDLSGNPFICDCQHIDFLRWMVKNKNRMQNFHSYQCWFNSDTNQDAQDNAFVAFKELDNKILPTLTIRCNSTEFIKYVFALAVLLLLALLTGLCVYNYYWDIKFCVLELNYRRRNYMRILERQQSERFEFDAFISFDINDYPWVLEEMVPALQSPECNLYIYPEQFSSGYIEDNIIRAMEKSHKIILLLSRNFVNSEWCLLEARMAFHRCLTTGFDLIIPILLEQIPEKVSIILLLIFALYLYKHISLFTK